MKSMIKYIPFLLLAIFCFACKNQDVEQKKIVKKEAVVEKSSRLDSLELISQKMYEKNPVRSIRFFDEMANIYGQQNQSLKRASTHLRLANIYSDYTNDIQKASHHAHMALGIYEQIKDTLQMAKLFSYCGYMSAQEGNVDFGKLQLNKAEQLFIGMNDQEGKVSTYFNMARVFYMEGNFEKSENFLKLARKYYDNSKDATSVFRLNNFAIELYRKIKNKSKVKSSIEENNRILKENKVDKILVSTFQKLIKN